MYLLQKIAGGIMLLLVIMYMKKTSQEVKTDEILKACARLFCPGVTTLDLRYDFALVLHENALVFSQSEAYNFFVYIINKVLYL